MRRPHFMYASIVLSIYAHFEQSCFEHLLSTASASYSSCHMSLHDLYMFAAMGLKNCPLDLMLDVGPRRPNCGLHGSVFSACFMCVCVSGCVRPGTHACDILVQCESVLLPPPPITPVTGEGGGWQGGGHSHRWGSQRRGPRLSQHVSSYSIAQT